MAVQVPPVTWRRDHVGLPLRLRGAWRRRSHGVVRSTAVHCYEHKRYLKHFKRYLKHLSMTNNNERRLRAGGGGGPLSRGAPAVTLGRTGTGSASPGGAHSRRLTILMSVPLPVWRHGAKTILVLPSSRCDQCLSRCISMLLPFPVLLCTPLIPHNILLCWFSRAIAGFLRHLSGLRLSRISFEPLTAF